MLTYVRGNLFESPAQVLVNTVNTVGVMGKGVALEFRRIYPEMFLEYRDLCERRLLDIGMLHLYKTRHKWILNFPTKRHWRQPSKIEYVERGLQKFVETYAKAGIHSVAFPPLGCGNGQLDFPTEVRPLMQRYLRNLPIAVFVYPEKRSAVPPEHRDQKGIAEWLRSEPAGLPFEEVWTDVLAILDDSDTFETPAQGKPYRVEAVEDPPALIVEAASGRTFRLDRDDLLEFWQQLRQFGLTHRGIAPEHYRVSYLMPVFERLPYVRRVEVSTSDEGLERNTAVGLQVIPPPRGDDSPPGELFAPSVDAD